MCRKQHRQVTRMVTRGRFLHCDVRQTMTVKRKYPVRYTLMGEAADYMQNVCDDILIPFLTGRAVAS